mmetsp:Transcript_33798/g.24841  ORF Transcript_33798/g.24841 Transcript_33798/m.24841 type:complete len:172 (+) Transcript_33798:358-873(+)
MLCASRRVHSIFLLRCFNDCIAMTLMYSSLLFLQKSKASSCLIFFSLALSVKMNILLFLPSLLLNLNFHFGLLKTMLSLLFILGSQAALGLPFILADPHAYLSKAFEFKREFMFKWSVNWQFLGEELAMRQEVAQILLVLHLFLLLLFLFCKWAPISSGISAWMVNLRLQE